MARHSKTEKAKLARMEANTCGICKRPIRALLGGCPGHTTDKDKARGHIPSAGVAVFRNGKRVTGRKAKWIMQKRGR